MSQKKPALIGRLAVQLKLITKEQLAQASAAQAQTPDKKLGEVLLALGLIDQAQLAKLLAAQRELIAKHRAKLAAASGNIPAAAAPPATPKAHAAAPPATPVAPAPAPSEGAPAGPAPSAPASEQTIHGAAARAAQEAAPVTQSTVQDLAGDPPAAARVPSTQPAPSPQPAAPPQPAPAAQAPTAAPSGVEVDGDSLGLALPEPDDAARQQLHGILGDAVQAGASDVHIHAGGALKLRLDGELGDHGSVQLDRPTAERMVAAALPPEQRLELCRDGEIDFCLDLPGVGRFRANAYRQQRGFDVVMRSIPAEPPTLEGLGLPEELAKLTDFHQGMVLLTGPAGCGKSATMAAMLDLINANRDEHILTVEDPIEVIHAPKRCLVNQRHAGRHTGSFARALRGALREDPDVIVIGELRDLETISLAMTAAETGHFVLATLHTNNAVRTINRLIGAFPSAEQGQVRAMLSESLRAVVSQRLVANADGAGRIPALEVLIINKAIGNLIRDEKTVQIRSSMQTGKAHGMYLLEQSLNEMVASGKITRETALAHAEEQKLITAGA